MRSSFICQLFIEASCVSGQVLGSEHTEMRRTRGTAFEEHSRRPGKQMWVIITRRAEFWGSIKDRTCGRSVIWGSRKASGLSFNEKFSSLGNESSAVRAQTGEGNMESFF